MSSDYPKYIGMYARIEKFSHVYVDKCIYTYMFVFALVHIHDYTLLQGSWNENMRVVGTMPYSATNQRNDERL